MIATWNEKQITSWYSHDQLKQQKINFLRYIITNGNYLTMIKIKTMLKMFEFEYIN